jgi:ABC-type polysaccharide/polyol phosphate export permease
MPYPLFAFCGLLTWNFTASSLKFAVTSLTGNTNLVTKVYFPREIFPTSAVLVSLVDLAVASLALVALLVWYQVGLHWTLVLMPVVLLVHLAFTLSVALILAMANLFYRDVKYLFEIFLTVWMFLTAVLYPVSLVGGRMGQVMHFNPVTPIIEAYRDVLIRGVVPGPVFGYAAAMSVIMLFAAWLAFHRAEFQFAENV